MDLEDQDQDLAAEEDTEAVTVKVKNDLEDKTDVIDDVQCPVTVVVAVTQIEILMVETDKEIVMVEIDRREEGLRRRLKKRGNRD